MGVPNTDIVNGFILLGITMIIAIVATVTSFAYFNPGRFRSILVTLGLTVAIFCVIGCLFLGGLAAFSIVQGAVSNLKTLTVQVEIVTPAPAVK